MKRLPLASNLRFTPIDASIDGVPGTVERFDPTLKFDANGNLFIAYGVDDHTNTCLWVARSVDGGEHFAHAVLVDSHANHFGIPGVDKWVLTTGLDPSTGNQAVYVAYTHNYRILGFGFP